jgi:hypothetical protein
MKLKWVIAAAAVAVACAIPMFASAGTVITTKMSADEIVNAAGGDPDGKASLTLKVNRVKKRVCFHLTYKNLEKVTGSFIHKGDAGEIARPIITLFEGNEASPVDGCVKGLKGHIVKRLKRKPALHYADIDTKEYPDGALRGQLAD